MCQNLICHKSDIEIFSVDSRHSHNTNLPRRRKISTAVKISWPRLTINLQLNWTFYNPTTVRELDVRHTYLRPARPDQIRIICSHADQKRNYDFEIMKMKGMKFIISSIYFCRFQPIRNPVGWNKKKLFSCFFLDKACNFDEIIEKKHFWSKFVIFIKSHIVVAHQVEFWMIRRVKQMTFRVNSIKKPVQNRPFLTKN